MFVIITRIPSFQTGIDPHSRTANQLIMVKSLQYATEGTIIVIIGGRELARERHP